LNEGERIISTAPGESDLDEGLDDLTDPGGEHEVRSLVFGADAHGERLDRALTALVPEFSRSYLAQLVEDGAVTLGGRVVRKSAHRVRAGEQGRIELRPTPQSQSFLPEPMDVPVVHEDDHVLVVDKPAGWVVHPAPGHWRGTLLNGLLARDPRAAQLPRAGIVHRLDKDTSGLMVVARSREAMEALVRAIAARAVSRQYLAIAHRAWQGADERCVDAAIGRDPRNRLRMAVVDMQRHAGKPARTDFRCLDSAEAGCLVHARLHTGRTHQIRVHLASIGHPLLADPLYGGAPDAALRRQALHAWRLAFDHPVTGAPMAFHSPLPDDLTQALSAWGLRYNAA
jgi:23S rRNA pseudouridine1911/1915/1917 synthase